MRLFLQVTQFYYLVIKFQVDFYTINILVKLERFLNEETYIFNAISQRIYFEIQTIFHFNKQYYPC